VCVCGGGGGCCTAYYTFLTTVLHWGEWSVSHCSFATLSCLRTLGTHWMGAGWAQELAGKDTEARGKIISPIRD
jgi:hypothetical protein